MSTKKFTGKGGNPDGKMLKLIAFDFDGTIADTVDLCIATFNKVFQKTMGPKAPGYEELLRQFGCNEEGIIRRYLGDGTAAGFAEFCRFHEEMHRTECPEPFPGMKELLMLLKSRSLKVVLLTGRSPETAAISLRILGLTGIFDACWNGSAETNSKARQMQEMLAQFQLAPEEAVYVGDAASDVKSSREAGLRCLSAAWAGSTRTAELEQINPGLVFRTIAELQKYLLAEI